MITQRPIRVAEDKRPGVTVFYCPSETEEAVDYVVQYIRRRRRRSWSCTCPDYVYDKLPVLRHCKHIRRVRIEAQEQGGVRKLAKLADVYRAATPPDPASPTLMDSLRNSLTL